MEAGQARLGWPSMHLVFGWPGQLGWAACQQARRAAGWTAGRAGCRRGPRSGRAENLYSLDARKSLQSENSTKTKQKTQTVKIFNSFGPVWAHPERPETSRKSLQSKSKKKFPSATCGRCPLDPRGGRGIPRGSPCEPRGYPRYPRV